MSQVAVKHLRGLCGKSLTVEAWDNGFSVSCKLFTVSKSWITLVHGHGSPEDVVPCLCEDCPKGRVSGGQ